ncbi:MAG: DUF2784 domain-containing protein [Gemmatimonadota bacterium]
MLYRVLADLVLVVHLGFIALVVFGGLLVLRRPRLAWIHLPAALWGAAIELGGWVCPLTPLENALRRAGGGAGYEGSFIAHYIVPIIYPPGLTRSAQLLLGLSVVALNAIVYALVWRRRFRAK